MEQTPFTPADRERMSRALDLARHAAAQGEVPVGAVLVDPGGAMLAEAGNQTITQNDPTAHAEMLCLRAGAAKTGNYRLIGCTLYVSLEPCPMCAGAVVWARVGRVVYGARDPRVGAYGSLIDLASLAGLNHHPVVEGGLMAEEAAALLKEFFAQRR